MKLVTLTVNSWDGELPRLGEFIKSERGFRRRVYATRVASGSMKEADAAFQIGIFEELEAEMRQRADAEDRAGRLL